MGHKKKITTSIPSVAELTHLSVLLYLYTSTIGRSGRGIQMLRVIGWVSMGVSGDNDDNQWHLETCLPSLAIATRANVA